VGITGLADFCVFESFAQQIPHPSPEEREIINHQNF
jgi:hypothetical protein